MTIFFCPRETLRLDLLASVLLAELVEGVGRGGGVGTLRVVGSDALAQLAIGTICSNGRINISLILLSLHAMTPLATTSKLVR